MTKKIEQRTVTVPMQIYNCDRCGFEQIDTGHEMLGWVCCHEFRPEGDGLAALAAQAALAPDQHLCPKCKHLVADAVRSTPLLPLDVATLRFALERIVRECVATPMRASPAAIAMIAEQALVGKEATEAEVEEKSKKARPDIGAALVNAIKTGKAQFILGPAVDNNTTPSSGDTEP